MSSTNSIRSILQIVACCFLFSNYNNGVEGGRRLITKEEDIELEKQLQLLNKPAIKSIQTKFGDIYDCVDFYKQPAFDHPLLKNHTFHPQMRPSSVPQRMREKELSEFNSNAFDNGFKILSCPFGTVPIRRVTKDDLIREKLHFERYDSKYNVLTNENPGTHYAMVQTTFDPNKKYNGGRAIMSTWNPSVRGSQYSSGRMKIANGPESIQIGWTVNPTLYGDNRTRLYIYTNTTQARCFNTRCSGFVIVDQEFTLGNVLQTSQRGGFKAAILFSIYRDAPVGNWWLVSADEYKVGFWPQKIFASLSDLATTVEWGGEVYSPPNIPSPPMGSGEFLEQLNRYDAGCEQMTIVNESHETVSVVDAEEYTDTKRYEAVNKGDFKGVRGYVMYFGGPGGATGN